MLFKFRYNGSILNKKGNTMSKSFEDSFADFGLSLAESLTSVGKALDKAKEKQPELEEKANAFINKVGEKLKQMDETITETVETIREEFKGNVSEKTPEEEVVDDIEDMVRTFFEQAFSSEYPFIVKSENGELIQESELLSSRMTLKDSDEGSEFKARFSFNKEVFSKRAVEQAEIFFTFVPETEEERAISQMVGLVMTISLFDKDGNKHTFNPVITFTKDEYKKLSNELTLVEQDCEVKRKNRTIKVRVATPEIPF